MMKGIPAALVFTVLAGCAPSRPLIVAAGAGDAARVDALIAAHEPVDARDEYGETALMRAAERGNLAIVQKLVAAGASTAATLHAGTTVLMRASGMRGNPEVVRFLLAHGSSVNERNHAGTTPLMSATAGGRIDIAQVLIVAGADPAARTKTGRTAFTIAKLKHNRAMLNFLLSARRPGSAVPADEADVSADAGKADTAETPSAPKEKQWWDQ